MTNRKPPVRIAEPDPNQIIMPGERLQCRADMPMVQKPLNIGFWDPMRDQLQMF